MEPLVVLLWIVLIGVIVGVVVWFGPRPSQWRTHDGRPTEDEPLEVLDEDQQDRG